MSSPPTTSPAAGFREGPTLVFDFDNYYMGGVLTEHLAAQGIPVSYVTPAGQASAWTIMTNELPLVHRALARRKVPVTTLHLLKSFDGETATLAHLFTGEETRVACRSVVIVGLQIAARRAVRDADATGGRRLRPPASEASIVSATRWLRAPSPMPCTAATSSPARSAQMSAGSPTAATRRSSMRWRISTCGRQPNRAIPGKVWNGFPFGIASNKEF